MKNATKKREKKPPPMSGRWQYIVPIRRKGYFKDIK